MYSNSDINFIKAFVRTIKAESKMHSPTISTWLASAMLLQMSIAVIPPSREGLNLRDNVHNIARGLDIDDSIPSNIVAAGVEKRFGLPSSRTVKCSFAILQVVADDSFPSSKLTKLGGAMKLAELVISLSSQSTDDIAKSGEQDVVDLLGLQPIKDGCLKS
jgi:hypothetical protein